MTTYPVADGQPNDKGLLHLLTQTLSDGRAIQHFICQDCLDTVEREAGSVLEHLCRAVTKLVAPNNSSALEGAESLPQIDIT